MVACRRRVDNQPLRRISPHITESQIRKNDVNPTVAATRCAVCPALRTARNASSVPLRNDEPPFSENGVPRVGSVPAGSFISGDITDVLPGETRPASQLLSTEPRSGTSLAGALNHNNERCHEWIETLARVSAYGS